MSTEIDEEDVVIPSSADLISQLSRALRYDLPPTELVSMDGQPIVKFLKDLGKMVTAHEEYLRQPDWLSKLEKKFEVAASIIPPSGSRV